MKRWLLILTLLFNFLPGWQEAGKAVTPRKEATEQTIQDGLHHSQRQQAVLSDNRDSYRLCTNRPQRLVPVNGNKSQRSSGKLTAAGLTRTLQTLRHSFGGRVQSSLTPFGFVASRDYYVIALRHIVR